MKLVALWVVEVARKLRAFIVVAEALSMATEEEDWKIELCESTG